MNASALFQILYQQETLFKVGDYQPNPALEQPQQTAERSKPDTEESAGNEPLPTTPSIQIPQKLETPKTAFPPVAQEMLILIDEPKSEQMDAAEAAFLENVLKAVGRSAAHADILNLKFIPGNDARSVLAEKRVNFFFSFGVPLIKLHLDLLLPPYEPKKIDGIWFLLADPLVVIEADRNLKRKLWQALQRVFEIP
jgi:hypothetical protein